MRLKKLLREFERTVVSFSADDYPISFPSTHFKILKNKIILPKPKGLYFDINKKRACMLFHTHNEFVKKIRSVTLYGILTQGGNFLEFEPKKCYKFKQGGFSTIRFIICGKRRVRKYLREHKKKSIF
ncbi:MAG: hypothetical protein NZ879_04410 [Archaeoglobaceae archaeon]|nr:hypothetical protein [Archaeoglobaceae archaeon]MDW8118206.1 hypothetical protein [Archaeoglobaceae archaeon]